MGSETVNPLDFPQAWDLITVAGEDSPGVCVVSECKREYAWDVKKGKGILGSTTTFTGTPPAKFSVKFLLWLPEHFDAWADFRLLLKYDPTRKVAQAIDIYHPSLSDIDVKSVITTNIGSIVHEGQQLYSTTVEFLEFYPAPKASAVGTPNQSQSQTQDPKTTPGTPPDPAVVKLQNEYAAAAAQAQKAFE